MNRKIPQPRNHTDKTNCNCADVEPLFPCVSVWFRGQGLGFKSVCFRVVPWPGSWGLNPCGSVAKWFLRQPLVSTVRLRHTVRDRAAPDAIATIAASFALSPLHGSRFAASIHDSTHAAERHIVPHNGMLPSAKTRAYCALDHAKKWTSMHHLGSISGEDICHANCAKIRQIVHAMTRAMSTSSRTGISRHLSSNSQRYLHVIC